MSAQAAALITVADMSGAVEGSTELSFKPGAIRPGSYTFDVGLRKGSAGSTLLIFQTIALPLVFAPSPSRAVIKGGTHVKLSPPADYIEEVFLPAISRFGIKIDFKNPVKGYYPIGKGEIEAAITPSAALSPVDLTKRGRLLKLKVISRVSNLPLSIAERQLKAALGRLKGFDAEGVLEEAPSIGRGTFVFILADFNDIKAGFSALGERGKRAEAVGSEAAEGFLKYMARDGACDPHLGDQIALCMALAKGRSAITTTEVTSHLLTNIHVIEKFLPVRFSIEGDLGKPGRVEANAGSGL